MKPVLALLTALSLAGVVAFAFYSSPADAGSPTQNLTNLQCSVNRTTIMSRAQVWVDQHVPYSQTSTHDGYRTDCSGYVSMSWELSKPGLTTSTLHTVSTNITKDHLQSGDAIICEGTHVILFGGWTDSTKTHYTAYEQTNPTTGTVKRVTPYPYWSSTSCYHPIRYNNVC